MNPLVLGRSGCGPLQSISYTDVSDEITSDGRLKTYVATHAIGGSASASTSLATCTGAGRSAGVRLARFGLALVGNEVVEGSVEIHDEVDVY